MVWKWKIMTDPVIEVKSKNGWNKKEIIEIKELNNTNFYLNDNENWMQN